jgi:hypothetical protein
VASFAGCTGKLQPPFDAERKEERVAKEVKEN